MISDLIFKLDNVDTWDGPLVDSLWPSLIDVVAVAEDLPKYATTRLSQSLAALKAKVESL